MASECVMCSMIARGAADSDVGNVPLLHGRVDHSNVIWGQFLSGVVIDAVVGVLFSCVSGGALGADLAPSCSV